MEHNFSADNCVSPDTVLHKSTALWPSIRLWTQVRIPLHYEVECFSLTPSPLGRPAPLWLKILGDKNELLYLLPFLYFDLSQLTQCVTVQPVSSLAVVVVLFPSLQMVRTTLSKLLSLYAQQWTVGASKWQNRSL